MSGQAKRPVCTGGRIPSQRPRRRVVCGWCGHEIRDGDPREPASHGLCKVCKQAYFPDRVEVRA